jgi:hypothetical protein
VEIADHMFFSCGVAKSVWGALASYLDASSCRRNLWQSLAWLYAYLPGDKKFYTLLTAAVFWSIWIMRNKITFNKHVLKSPVAIIFTMCSFMNYCEGLYETDECWKIEDGS